MITAIDKKNTGDRSHCLHKIKTNWGGEPGLRRTDLILRWILFLFYAP